MFVSIRAKTTNLLRFALVKTIAIVIGCSVYKDSAFETIPGAQADAKRFATSLISWGVPKEWVFLLQNEKATKANFVKTFYDCRAIIDNETKLIFYFAGHGIRECHLYQSVPESSLILHDTHNEKSSNSDLTLTELLQLIRMLKPSQTFLLVDACNLHLENPLNEEDLLSTINSKGLFCLFSSGLNKSYEDRKFKYGYFTHELVQAISELRHDPEANCSILYEKVAQRLEEKRLHLPVVYQVRSENIWLLEKEYKYKCNQSSEALDSLIMRSEAIATLQPHLLSSSDSIVWIYGKGGCGKTILAEQLTKQNLHAIYTSIPHGSADILNTLIGQIRSHHRELFFNRPLENALDQTLKIVIANYSHVMLILDHLDRLSAENLSRIAKELDSLSLPCVLISRHPPLNNLFVNRKNRIIAWEAAPFNLKEIEQLVLLSGLDTRLSSKLWRSSEGNPLKARQLLLKFSLLNPGRQKGLYQDYIKTAAAIVACGGFQDESLFCKTFKIPTQALITLQKLGLIRYMRDGCFPHDILLEMAEEGNWPIDLETACLYWKRQIQSTPYSRCACRSLVLLCIELPSRSRYKSALMQCLDTLNDKENISYLIDLVKIFQEESWEDLSIIASGYLILHEETDLAEKVLSPLLTSKLVKTKQRAFVNDSKRLLWKGNFSACVQLYMPFLKTCKINQATISVSNHVGISLFLLGRIEEAMQLFLKNIDYKRKKDEREDGISKFMAAMIMKCKGENVSGPKEIMEKCLRIFEITQDYHAYVIALNGLAGISFRLQQWQEALYYLNHALDIATSLQNKPTLLLTLRNLARLQLKLFGAESPDLRLTAEHIEFFLNQTDFSGGVWITLWAQNTLGTIYAHWKETEKLEILMDNIIKTDVKHGESHIRTLSNLGHLAALKNHYSEAKSFYYQAYRLCNEMKQDPFLLQELKADFINCGFPPSLQDFS